MNNKTIYRKTLGFSVRRLFWDVLSLVLLLAACTLGYMLGEKFFQNGLVGLAIGGLIGIILMILVLRFLSYKLKAGQIAMMTHAITEGELPDQVIAEGKKVVKERFKTVAAYFAVTGLIKGVFHQLGRGVTKAGQSIGGDVGGTVGSVISSGIQTLIAYLCDCCLGWVFYRKEVKATKATCEGAVLFFRHGKTLLKNAGRIIGMGLVSLLLIGGAFGGIIYLILSTQAQALAGVYAKVAELAADTEGWSKELLTNPATLPIVFAAVGGLIIWSFVHSTFIRPLVLTGVLRNYLESGMQDIPSEDSFRTLDARSAKFRKLHSEL